MSTEGQLRSASTTDEAVRTVILHYHLFKNAGSSLDALLKDKFPGQWASKEFAGDLRTNRRQVGEWIVETPEAICFSSHTALLPPPKLPDTTLIPVIFVRHPIDRVASAYAFERGQGDSGFGSTLARNTTLRGYVETRLSLPHDRQCRNFHVARFAPMFGGDATDEFDRALRAVAALPFIGVVEDFEGSLARLQEVLATAGFTDAELKPVQRNASEGRSASLDDRLHQMAEDLGQDCFDDLVRANEADLALYRAVTTSVANDEEPSADQSSSRSAADQPEEATADHSEEGSSERSD